MVSSSLLDAGRSIVISMMVFLFLTTQVNANLPEVDQDNFNDGMTEFKRDTSTGLEDSLNSNLDTRMLSKRDTIPTYGKMILKMDQWTAFGTKSTQESVQDHKKYNTAPDPITWTYYNWNKDKPYKDTFNLYSYDESKISDGDKQSEQWPWNKAQKTQRCEVHMNHTEKVEPIVTIHIHGPDVKNEQSYDSNFAKVICDPYDI